MGRSGVKVRHVRAPEVTLPPLHLSLRTMAPGLMAALRGLGRSEAAYEPAEQEDDCTREKDGKTRRVVPGIVDILTDIEKGPKEERACAEILNDLGGLGCN